MFEILGLLVLLAVVVAVHRGQPEQCHRKTDPACSRFKPPTGWLSRRRYERGRGKACRECAPGVMTLPEAMIWLSNLGKAPAARWSCWSCDDCRDPSHNGRKQHA